MPIRFTRPFRRSVGFRITSCRDESVLCVIRAPLDRDSLLSQPLAHTLNTVKPKRGGVLPEEGASQLNHSLNDQEGTVDGTRKERRGFASMSREKQREIASKGGRAAHEKGTAHEWTPDEARAAGRKGGQSSRGGRGRLVPISPSEVHNLQAGSGTGREPGRAD
jgi:general stress protein YciG